MAKSMKFNVQRTLDNYVRGQRDQVQRVEYAIRQAWLDGFKAGKWRGWSRLCQQER